MDSLQVNNSDSTDTPTSNEKRNRIITLSAVTVTVVLIVLFCFSIYFLLQDAGKTEQIKNIMIIVLGFEFILIGTSTVILLLQFSKLINLIQNEVKPLLESANKTIYTLKGTALFISDSFVQPVVKLNGYLAAAKKLFGFINFNK